MADDPLAPLDEHTVAPDPFEQFGRWYEAAVGATGDRAAAMTVATVDVHGAPSARVVLLRGIGRRGLVFYTNYSSRKGTDLAAHPAVAAVLYWPVLDAQVRVEGVAERIDAEESDAYFSRRPRGHQIGAWASHQSEPVPDRVTLEAQVRDVEARFPGTVPRPEHWGGYRIVVDRFEFWRNRADRVHDRVEYRRTTDGWSIGRLSP
jgi:pyridoxamine 5'-phosphate oxidase